MKFINLPKPHGFLIWRGKQTTIASPTALLSGEKMLVISDGEPYGEAILSQPVAVNLSGFEDMQDSHCVRPEDRKLYWPDADKFFVYKFKDWLPYEDFVPTGKFYDNEEVVKRVLPRRTIELNGDEAEVLDLPEPTSEQQKLLEQVERLPKTLILLDEAVRLEDGKAVYCSGVDCSKLEPVLAATLDGAKSADSLPLYQLALVRIPRLAFREKKSNTQEGDKAMPYSKVKRGDEWCVIKSDTEEVEKCYDDESKADDYLAALRANVNEGKSVKELIAEARKCYDEGMPMSVMYGGPTSFAEFEAIEEEHEKRMEVRELTFRFQTLSSNIFNSPDVEDKASALAALANEYGGLVGEAVKSATVDEDNKAGEGYLVPDGNHLPTRKVGKLDHGLMGSAWAALHGGYRGNKYEGPNKSQAIAKLKKLYESEGMDTPSEKGDTEVPEGEKVGKRIRQSMKDRLKQAWETIKEVMDWAEPVDETALDMMSKSIAIKQVNGKPWFIAYSTNAFEDREQEIFSTKSLEQYVQEAETKKDRGTFNFWHIPGSDFAQKEWQAVVGRFLVEAGPFLDNELGQAALKFFNEYPDGHPDIAPEGWGCSPEYRYLPEERKSGVYENIWITRTSALPRLAAANIWTKGTIMAVTEGQEKAGKLLFGGPLYDRLIKPAEVMTKELEEANVNHKEVTAEVTEPATIEVPVNEIANEVVKLIDLAAFGEALTLMGQQLVELQGEIKALKKTEDIKNNEDTPRLVWSMVQRASQAEGTKVADDDDLKGKKPVEAQATDKSGAAAFFTARG